MQVREEDMTYNKHVPAAKFNQIIKFIRIALLSILIYPAYHEQKRIEYSYNDYYKNRFDISSLYSPQSKEPFKNFLVYHSPHFL